jgi:hypothetical protein
MSESRNKPSIKNTIVAISEGLLGMLLYKSKVNISGSYTEQALYEHILHIAKRDWNVHCEYPVKTLKSGTKGDNKRVDFLLSENSDNNRKIAIEVKYLKNTKSVLNIDADKLKIQELKKEITELKGFILVFWRSQGSNEINSKKLEKLDLEKYHECSFTTNLGQKFNCTVYKV